MPSVNFYILHYKYLVFLNFLIDEVSDINTHYSFLNSFSNEQSWKLITQQYLFNTDQTHGVLLCSRLLWYWWLLWKCKILNFLEATNADFHHFMSWSVHNVWQARGGAVGWGTVLKPEGRWFYSKWYHWNFSLTCSFWLHHGPEVDSASNRNEY